MVSRMVVLLYLIIAQGSFFVLEQPANSLMAKVSRLLQLKDHLEGNWFPIHTYMGEFGGETPKATRLWSNHRGIRSLTRNLDPKKFEKSNLTVVDQEKKAAGITCVTGSRNELKMSQAYPMGYGKAVHQLYATSSQQHTYPPEDEEEDSDLDIESSNDNIWEDAWKSQIAAWLRLPNDKSAM